MALEDDINTLKREMEDMIDVFQALNATVSKSVTAFGGQITSSTKAVQANTAATQKQTQATQKQAQVTQQQTRATQTATEAIQEQIKAANAQIKSQAAAKTALDDFYTSQRKQRNYLRELAQAHIDAERQARTFASRLEQAAGDNYAAQRALIVWTSRLKSAGQTIGDFGGKLGSFGKGLAEGDTKFTSLNPLIDSMSGAVSKALESIPLFGGALAATSKLAGEGLKFLTQQLQTAVEAFQDVGRVGGLTASGMEGVMRQFQASGMTLEGFKKTVAENAQSLAAFGGTVGAGAERFSQVSKEIVDSDLGDYLRRLGFSADEMGAASARFIGIQARLGATQGKSFQELARSSQAYMKELDLIAKLTGQSREESQRRLDEMLRENRFAAELAALEASGQKDVADRLRLTAQIFDAQNKDLGQAFRATVGGIMNDEMSIAFNTVGINVQKFSDDIKYNGKEVRDVLIDSRDAFRDSKDTIIGLGRVLDNTTTIIPNVNDALKVMSMDVDAAAAAADQDRQQTNKLTGQTVDAQKAMEQMSRNISSLATSALPAFSTAVRLTTQAMNELLKSVGVKGATGGATGAAGGATGAAGGAPAAGPGAASGAGAGSKAQGAGMKTAPDTGAAAASLPKIREMISQVESRGDYNVMVGGARHPLTTMTVAEVMDLQKQLISQGQNSAAGKYQIKYSTLADIMGKAGVGRNDKFDESTQDRLADALIMRRGFNQYAGNPTPDGKARFLANLAMEWAGLPGGPSGESYYKGVGNNKAGMGWDQALASFQTGGIATGPKSGYSALLHGTEAVIPLPDGKTIPVEMPNFDRSMQEQVGMMGAQLMALEEIVRVMRDSNSISARILQAANN